MDLLLTPKNLLSLPTKRDSITSVTPEHACANGKAESFMTLNKNKQITHLKGQNYKIATQEKLAGYCSTPHPATGVTHYKALINRQARTKPDYQAKKDSKGSTRNMVINRREAEYKEKIKLYAQNKNTKEHTIIGHHVLIKRKKTNKWSTAFDPTFYIVTLVGGSSIAARTITDERDLYQDTSQFKLTNTLIKNHPDQEIRDQGTESDHADWRQGIFINARNRSEAEEARPRPEPTVERADYNPEQREVLKPVEPGARWKWNRQQPRYLESYVV